jgi:prephenate dehydrogenase
VSDSAPFGHQTVAVVGLGLMGASLAGALRGKCARVVGIARRRETVQRALQLGLIDWGTQSTHEGVQQADIVVLATPVRTILTLVTQVGPWLRSGTVLMDLGSTKHQVTDAMQALPDHVQPIGGHPMCGRERSGIEAADPALYIDRIFVLTPLERTSAAAKTTAEEFVRALGARPLLLEPVRHDRLVATISHLPYLLSAGLVLTAESTAPEDPALWALAASGFRDTSRLAASEVEMMLDILLTNQQPILDRLALFQEQMHSLQSALAHDDVAALRAMLNSARQRRGGMYQ